jgi:hypothetical protein
VSNFFNARMKLVDLNAAQVGMWASVARLPGRSLSATGASVLLYESARARSLAVLEKPGLMASRGGAWTQREAGTPFG